MRVILTKGNRLSIILCFITLFFNRNLFAQVKSDTDELIYNRVYKNIAAYNIAHARQAFNGAIDESPFHHVASFFYEFFLPDYGWKMIFKTTKLDTEYPNPEYKLYEIELDGLRFENGLTKSSVSGRYPGKYFLIAMTDDFKKIKFISGQFYYSAISEDFNLNFDNPQSLIDYLKLRFYLYKVDEIKFVKKRGNKFYFHGFSAEYKKPVEIILNRKKGIEYPSIKPLK